MPSPADIQDEALRAQVQKAYDAMRSGNGTDAVRLLADTFLDFIERFPEVKEEKVAMRGREVPKLMRWPGLGANVKAESLREGKPEIEFVRERFSVSEAMTYYQFLLEEILAKEKT